MLASKPLLRKDYGDAQVRHFFIIKKIHPFWNFHPVHWMVASAGANDDADLLWEKNTAEWLADSGW
jgi:hypothetical protein